MKLSVKKKFYLLAIIFVINVVKAAEQKVTAEGSRSTGVEIYNSPAGDVGCYSFVKNIINEDKESTSFGILKSMYSGCTKEVNLFKVQQNFGDSKSYARFLINKRYNQISPGNQFKIEKCENEKKIPIHEITSKYYYLISRINLGQESLISQIAGLGKVLGDQRPLEQLKCADSDFEQVKKICDEYKKCLPAEDSVAELASLTVDTLKNIELLERKIEYTEANIRHGQTTPENRKKFKSELLWLKAELENQKNLIPWTQGDIYKKTIKSGNPLAQAIKKQFEADRKELIKNYTKLEKIKKCTKGVNQQTDNCAVEDIRELAQLTPEIPMVSYLAKDKTDQLKMSFANLEIDSQQCIFRGRIDQLKASDVINESMAQAGLTVLTLGLGSAAGLTRALYSRALMTEKVAEGLVKGATFTRLGIDGGVFLKETKEAIDVCNKYSLEQNNQTKNNMCDTQSVVLSLKHTQHFSDCMLAVTFAGISGGRLAFGELRAALSQGKVTQLNKDSQEKLNNFLEAYQAKDKNLILQAASKLDNISRFSAAEIVLGRSLNLSERKALLKAHLLGGENGFYEYTKAELKSKMKTLMAAGLNKDEADKLLRQGIAGRFSGENAKLSEQGLLDSQLKDRNTADNLKTYEEDLRHQVSSRTDWDNRFNTNKKEIEDVEKKLNSQKGQPLSTTEREKLEEKLSQLQKKREEIFNEFNNSASSISDQISDARASVLRTTEQIDRVRDEFYKITGKSLSSPNQRLKIRLEWRKDLFEREGFLEVQKNLGNPEQAIPAFRRAVKDLNEIQKMGYQPQGPKEAMRNLNLRAIGQDFKGSNRVELEKVLAGNESKIEQGLPILNGEFNPSKVLPSMDKGLSEDTLWKAYVNLSQRKADQIIVRDLLEDRSFLQRAGIAEAKTDEILDKYIEATTKAEEEISKAIRAKYPNLSAQKLSDVIKSFVD